mgnify:CR=1 FL=1
MPNDITNLTGTWSLVSSLYPDFPERNGHFGSSVRLGRDPVTNATTVAITARDASGRTTSSQAGVVYIALEVDPGHPRHGFMRAARCVVIHICLHVCMHTHIYVCVCVCACVHCRADVLAHLRERRWLFVFVLSHAPSPRPRTATPPQASNRPSGLDTRWVWP